MLDDLGDALHQLPSNGRTPASFWVAAIGQRLFSAQVDERVGCVGSGGDAIEVCATRSAAETSAAATRRT
jgi:hypothetical protein